jgi:hypothetical protein
MWMASILVPSVFYGAFMEITKVLVGDKVWTRVRKQVWNQVKGQVRDQVKIQIIAKAAEITWDQMKFGVRIPDHVFRGDL